jgi:hypothetical protein
MSAQRKPTSALTTLHIVAMAGLAVWWALYFWRHTPARDLLRRTEETPAVQHRRTSAGAFPDHAASELGRRTRRAVSALALAAADMGGGLVVLFLFGVGTGIYVRRFEIWLQARGSGEAMTFAGTGLDDKTLAANRDRGHRP